MQEIETLGVLGCGSIGLRHIQNALNLGLKVIVYDATVARMGVAVGKGAIASDSRAQLVKMSDAVLIATPSGSHREDVLAALELNRPILVEKPFVTEITDKFIEQVDAAEQRGVLIAAAMNMRFNTCVQAARTLIDDNRLKGPIWAHFIAASYLPGWRPGQDYRVGYAASSTAGGAIFDFTHEIDLACHLIGAAELKAAFPRQSGHLQIASEDIADIVMDHRCGCRSTIHVDYLTRPRRRGFEIAFANGFISVDLEKGTICAYDEYGDRLLDASPPSEHSETYVAMLENFLAKAVGREGAICSAKDALCVSRLAIDARSMHWG